MLTANLSKTATLQALATLARPSDVYIPDDISEQSGLNAWAVSTLNRAEPIVITPELARGTKPVRFKKKLPLPQTARGMAAESDGAGSPLIRENYLEISISNGNDTHGSLAEFIRLHFSDGHRIKLLGPFQRGATLKWDFNTIQDFMENIDTDAWDELTLETESGDGIKIERIKLVHSGETILDWNELLWLDNSILEAHRFISLTAQILQTKLEQIDHNWIAQIHWAAREIGKTDGLKYGTGNAWCSEFASWALSKGGWEPPQGNIGSQDMEDYFAALGRAHQVSEILNGSYILNAGDYLRFEWADGGQHSGIFIGFVDNTVTTLTNSTELITIEGNTSATVRVRTSRTLNDVISCGNTR